MKRILFRGKRFNGEWVYGFYTELKGVPKIINEYGVFDVLRDTVGQLIHCDDNLEIFVGDIVQNTISGNIFVVKFNHSWKGFEPFISYEGYKAYKVIGNIYDNRELLKGVER